MPVEIYTILKNYGDNYEKKFNEAATKLEKAKNDALETFVGAQGAVTVDKFNLDQYIASLSEVDKFYYKLYAHFGKLNDAKLDGAVSSINAVGQALNANTKFAVENMRLYNQLFKGGKTPVPGAPVSAPMGNFGNVMGSELQKQLAVLTDPTLAQRVSANFKNISAGMTPELEKIKKDIEDFANSVSASLENLVEGTIVTFASSVGEAFASGDWSNFGASMLDSLGKWAQQFGALLIASGVALTALFTGDPYTKIIAGAALVAIGAALSAVATSPPKSAGSGFQSTGTSVGSSSYSSNNNKTYELVWRRVGKDLIAMFKEESNSVKTLTGRR
jgi:hypothetical protein